MLSASIAHADEATGRPPESDDATKSDARRLFGEGVDRSLQEIEVVRDGGGPPAVRLSGTVLARATRLGLGPASLSLSHDGDTALASVVWMVSP